MSHLSVRPLEADEQESLDSLLNLPISASNEAIQKTSSTSFGNKEFSIDLSNIEIQFPYKTTSAYKTYTYDGSNRITRIDYYSDVGLTQYIFSKETDWSSYPTTVTTFITDRVTGKTRLITTNLTGGLVTDSSDIIT